jgi:hypothetical protein
LSDFESGIPQPAIKYTVPRTPGGASSVGIDPINPQKLYAAGSKVFMSTDGGASWSDISSGITGFESLDVTVVIDPSHPQNVYAFTLYKGTVYRLSSL